MNALVTQDYAISDIERMAKAIAQSKLFGIQTPEQAIALCLVAQAEGRHPATAAQDYNIIQGRPAKKADAMLRDFLGAGGKVEWHTLTNACADATFSHPAGGTARIDWDMKRAAEAQLRGKDMWKKFPRQMLRARVISEGIRTIYPMATSGMYVPEEVQDFAPDPAPNHEPATPALTDQSGPRNVTPKPEEPKTNPAPRAQSAPGIVAACKAGIDGCKTEDDIRAWWAPNQSAIDDLNDADFKAVKDHYEVRWGVLAGKIKAQATAAEVFA